MRTRKADSQKSSRSAQKGFGCQSKRFGGPEHVVPGPGLYHKPRTLLREMETCGSVSKLGYSIGFVSRVKRFEDHADDDDAVPGPGKYQVPLSSLKKVQPRRTSDSSLSPDCIPAADPSPGPGEYDPKFVQHRLGIRSSFTRKTHARIQPKEEAPPPGSYYTPLRASSTRSAVSAFRSRAKRGMELVSACTPGPGEYGRGDSIPEQKVRPSSVFATSSLDRFGEPYEQKSTKYNVPGVGHYETPKMERLGNQIASSFLSRSKRGFEASSMAPPGPAYYKPKDVINKRSHLLNVGRYWI